MGLNVNSFFGGEKSVYKTPLNLLTIHDMGIVFLGLSLFLPVFLPSSFGARAPIFPGESLPRCPL